MELDKKGGHYKRITDQVIKMLFYCQIMSHWQMESFKFQHSQIHFFLVSQSLMCNVTEVEIMMDLKQ